MPRSMWSGNISFGLVNIPIKLYRAVRDNAVKFHMLSEDGTCRLRRKGDLFEPVLSRKQRLPVAAAVG